MKEEDGDDEEETDGVVGAGRVESGGIVNLVVERPAGMILVLRPSLLPFLSKKNKRK